MICPNTKPPDHLTAAAVCLSCLPKHTPHGAGTPKWHWSPPAGQSVQWHHKTAQERDKELKVSTWPQNSPKLSLTEHLWDALSHVLGLAGLL